MSSPSFWNKSWSDYFEKKNSLILGKGKIKTKWDKKNLMWNDDVINNNGNATILITWLILKFLLSFKDVFTSFQVICVK